MRTGFSIRTKLLLVALLLLLIPWMSYIYVRDLKTFLLSGQESALSLTSRAVATVLHDRPELFAEDSQIKPEDRDDNDIYAIPLADFIELNGDLNDWGEQVTQAIRYVPDNESINVGNDTSVKHLLGYRGNFMYGFFEVADSSVQLRKRGFLRVNAADHIRITLQDPGPSERRYTLVAREPGRMSVYIMDDKWQYPITGQPNYDIAAEIKLTEQGYNVEVRIPRFMLSSETRLSLAVVDVDDAESLAIEAIIPTTPQSENDDLSRILVQSPEIAKILKGLDRSDTRIWVIDKDKHVRTVVGEISNNSASQKLNKPSSATGLEYVWESLRYYYNKSLQTIFNIIEQPAGDFADIEGNVDKRNDLILDQALRGELSSDRRPSLDNQGTILMSGHPIFLGDDIPGAVIIEQSSNQGLEQQQEILENVISVTLLVLITVATALLFFASRLTLRIRRLRNATETAIDRDGRIISQKLDAEAKSGDELGDLSRSVSNMLGRLSQYTSYLRGLPDTLAHEVSNPLNVVNSSLHNLSEEIPDSADSKYMERAKNGVNRIGSILRNLTEAANLEQAMQAETREVIDLAELIESYVDGYSFSNPEQAFDVIIHSRPLLVEIAPDYIAQALDKLVDNAIDFASEGTAIVFKARKLDNFAQIDIINQGSHLPEGMAERIFEPLVSLGRKDAQKISLGMGLYIVKLIASFHGGDVLARNLLSSDGVIFSLSLPIHDTSTSD